MMESASGIFGGIVLIAAGLYQWSPLNDTCLRQCETPLGFLMSRGGFRSDPFAALRLGAEHGAYCVGCCWVLMTLLFVGGIMNVLWIAGLTILILLEKVVPMGRLVPRVAGCSHRNRRRLSPFQAVLIIAAKDNTQVSPGGMSPPEAETTRRAYQQAKPISSNFRMMASCPTARPTSLLTTNVDDGRCVGC